MTPERRVAVLALLGAALGVACAGRFAWLAERLPDGRPELAQERPSDLPPPEGLHATSTDDRRISLAWHPVLVGDVAGYAVLRSDDARGPYSQVARTDSRFATVVTDAGESDGALGDGRTYHYRVHPYDAEGRISRSHAYLVTRTAPGPEPPLGVQVYSHLPRRVVLSWEPSADASVSGYAVYRCPSAAGPWEQRALIEGRVNAVHEDAVDGDLRVMYYRVSAHNRFANESAMTEPLRAVTKAEPLAPIELSVARKSLGRVDLRWERNVEPDLARYEIWRAARPRGVEPTEWQAEQRIGSVDVEVTEFADRAVGCGAALRYRLRAIDRDELVSEFSDTLEVTGLDLGLELTPQEGGAWQLSWDPERVRGWRSVRVHRVRFALPDALLGNVRGKSHLRLPAPAVRPRQLLVVSPTDEDPGADVGAGAEHAATLAPSCEIRVPG